MKRLLLLVACVGCADSSVNENERPRSGQEREVGVRRPDAAPVDLGSGQGGEDAAVEDLGALTDVGGTDSGTDAGRADGAVEFDVAVEPDVALEPDVGASAETGGGDPDRGALSGSPPKAPVASRRLSAAASALIGSPARTHRCRGRGPGARERSSWEVPVAGH